MSDVIKHIEEEISFIDNLIRTKQVKVSIGSKIISQAAYLKKIKPKGYSIEISSGNYFRLEVGKQVKGRVTGKDLNFSFSDAYVRNSGSALSTGSIKHRSKINLFSFEKRKINKSRQYYFRIVIPVKTDFSFYYILSDETYTNGESGRMRGLIKAELNARQFHIFITEKDKKKYLVIDCLVKTTMEDFSELSWSLMVAIGYLTGHLLQDEEYIFIYNNKELKKFSNFEYSQRRDSIKTFYTPVNSNPYAWVKENSKIADKYYGKIRAISPDEISRLGQLIHDEVNIKAIILLITESLSRSLLLMPAGLSVALEGLSEYFSEKNAEKIKPIQKKKEARKFKDELLDILEKYSLHDGFTGYGIIKSKIETINSPTNREKLKAPFTFMGIPLTEIDEEILEYRNDFLHGNINLLPKKGRRSYSMDSYEISMRLLTLLNMVIMKMAGYGGHIINHVKTQEEGLGKVISEEYYRMI